MPDQEAVAPTGLAAEIGASLASVWARYVGTRPGNAETKINGNVVHWTLADGSGEFDQALTDGAVGDEAAPTRTAAGYKRDISAAVAKATGSRVAATIRKQDAKTGAVTETFILRFAPKKY